MLRILLFIGETVADGGFGEEVAGLGGVGFEFLAELVHVDAEVVGFLRGMGAPDFGEELFVGEDAAGVFDEGGEEAVLGGCEVDGFAGEGDFAAGEVDAEVAGGEDGVGL